MQLPLLVLEDVPADVTEMPVSRRDKGWLGAVAHHLVDEAANCLVIAVCLKQLDGTGLVECASEVVLTDPTFVSRSASVVEVISLNELLEG